MVGYGTYLSFDSFTGGSIVGDMAPYQAFAIGGFDSVRGYGEGAVGSGRSCVVMNSEVTIPLVCEKKATKFMPESYIIHEGLSQNSNI